MNADEGKAAARQRLLREIAELREHSMPLSLEKKQLETALSDIKSRLRVSAGRLSPREHTAICNEQVSCKRRISRLEAHLHEIKKQLRAKHTELDLLGADWLAPGENPQLRAELHRLRDHWGLYATDAANNEKCRGLAAEFSSELRALLSLLREER